jgi:DUF1016 N-terminal domain
VVVDGSGAAAWTGVSAPSSPRPGTTGRSRPFTSIFARGLFLETAAGGVGLLKSALVGTKLAPVVRESETRSVLLSACKEMTTAGSASGAEMTPAYIELLSGIVGLLEEGRPVAARSVNAALTTTYWLVGWRLVEHDQGGEARATYGSELLKRLSRDLQSRMGRGFSERNLEQMRQFYLQWPIPQTLPAEFGATPAFPLSWSHYVRLLSVVELDARRHYEAEAIRGGWSVRQLDRQISTLAYQRSRAAAGTPEIHPSTRTPESEIRDPVVLEFLGPKDEYSESELEQALILFASLNSSCSSWGTTSHSSPARSGFVLAANGTASTSFSSIGGFGLWLSSI